MDALEKLKTLLRTPDKIDASCVLLIRRYAEEKTLTLDGINNAFQVLTTLKGQEVELCADTLFALVPKTLKKGDARPKTLAYVVKGYAALKPQESAKPSLPPDKINVILAFLANTLFDQEIGKYIALTLNGLSKLYRKALDAEAIQQVLLKLERHVLDEGKNLDDEELTKTISMAIHGAGVVVADTLSPDTVQFFLKKFLQHVDGCEDSLQSISMLLYGCVVQEGQLHARSVNLLLETMLPGVQTPDVKNPELSIAMALYGAKQVPEGSLSAREVNTLLELNLGFLRNLTQRKIQILSMCFCGVTQLPKGFLSSEIANAYLALLHEELVLKEKQKSFDEFDAQAIAVALNGAAKAPKGSLNPETVNALLAKLTRSNLSRPGQTIALALNGASEVPEGALDAPIVEALYEQLLNRKPRQEEVLSLHYALALHSANRLKPNQIPFDLVNKMLRKVVEKMPTSLRPQNEISMILQALHRISSADAVWLDLSVCAQLVQYFFTCGLTPEETMQISVVCQFAYHYKRYRLLLEQKVPSSWPPDLKQVLIRWQCESLRKQKCFDACIELAKSSPMGDADKHLQCCVAYCYTELRKNEEAQLIFVELIKLGKEDPVWLRAVCGLVYSKGVLPEEKQKYAEALYSQYEELKQRKTTPPSIQNDLLAALKRLHSGCQN